jgi:hypothetical protein
MRFRERLYVPVLWWLLAAGFALTLLLALGLSIGPAWGVGAAAASLTVTTALFVRSMWRLSRTYRWLATALVAAALPVGGWKWGG